MNGPKMFGSWKPPATRLAPVSRVANGTPPTNRARHPAAQIGTPVIRSPSSTIRARRTEST